LSAAGLMVRPAAGRRAPIARANPVAKLGVSLAVSATLVLTVDPVTAGTALALEMMALPWCGLRPRDLVRRGAVIAVAAISVGTVTVLFGVHRGTVLVGFGPWTVTQGSLLAGLAITLRVLAVGLPGVVLLATTDPTDLADALSQIVRLPATFVLSALAAMRLFGVLAEEWQSLTLARRARGLGDGGRFGGFTTVPGQVFALLVLAIRRATVLAVAMEARGFGTGRPRTWARPSRLSPGDLLLLGGGVLLAATATAAGVLAGTWSVILG
jgi:energy-coupling factor transport system permease protein